MPFHIIITLQIQINNAQRLNPAFYYYILLFCHRFQIILDRPYCPLLKCLVIIFQLIFLMGNTSTAPNTCLDITADFKQLSISPRGIMLQHNQSGQTYLLKEYTYASEKQYQQQRLRFQREISHPLCENMLKVYKIKTLTITGLCSTTHKIYVIYEQPQVSLQDEIVARKKESKRFEQNELWSVLQSCTLALSHLKSSISLNTHNVFITPEGELKVIHNDMITEDYRFTVDRGYFYAPQKIQNFNRLDNQINLAKEAVFSMGMTLLQTALLTQSIYCYDYERMAFQEEQLVNHLRQLQAAYSADFIEVMELLLSLKHNLRPSCSDIQKLLDNYWNNSSRNEQQQPKNGESLNIQIYDAQKRFLMTSQDGVFKNLATITSNQKESVRRDNIVMNSSPATKAPGLKEQAGKLTNTEQTGKVTNTQAEMKQEPARARQSVCAQGQRENIYTDPKLLEMIKKDLECINKLKQSNLKETIKYSYFYPGDSIFSSIQDLKLSYPYKPETNAQNYLNSSNNQSAPKPLQESVQNQIPTPSPFQSENHLEFHKKSNIQSSKTYQLSNPPIPNLVYCQQADNEGRYYQGYKLNGQKHGKGKLMYYDGAYYQGEFLNDQMNGKGVLYYKLNKPAYDGSWINGQFHGSGVLYNENPQYLSGEFNFSNFDEIGDYWRKYEGDFYFDDKCGRGKLYLSNGEIIEGRFDQDMINGECEFVSKQGRTVRGRWEENRLVQLIE